MDFYNEVYQNTYGPTRKATSAGYEHNCCNQCNGAGIVVIIVSAVAGFLISWVMTDGVRKEWNDRNNMQDLPENPFIDPLLDDENFHLVEEGSRLYGPEEYPGNFWNWVLAGAGALLSIGVAAMCMHCCAKSKNRIEGRHNLVGAELAGMLTEKNNMGPHGVLISQEDRGFGPPFPPNKRNLNSTVNPYCQPMRDPPLSQPPMDQLPMSQLPMIHPPIGRPPINQPQMRINSMPQPPMHQMRQIDEPNLYVGPIDESTKKYKKGVVTVHKPKVRESIVGYEKTEIALDDYSNKFRKSNRRQRSRHSPDSEE